MREISWLADDLFDSQEGLCSVELVITVKGKGKVFPLQAWNGSWGSRRLSLLDLLDFRHYEGGKVFTPSSFPGTHF
jgi:hypothetical protein